MPIPSNLFSKVPNIPAVYCLNEKNDVIYVGTSGRLKDKLRHHFIRKDSSIKIGTIAASLNAECVDEVNWWTHESFSNRNKLEAAEILAFEIYNPILRNRRKLSESAKAELTTNFKRSMRTLFRAKPSGEIFSSEEKRIFQQTLWLAEFGIALEQTRLGNFYATGTGVSEDLEKAIHWWTLAAEQSEPRSSMSLGYAYSLGNGVTKDSTKAFYYFKLSAELGFKGAQLELAECYRLGKGTPLDYEKAVNLTIKLAMQGCAKSQYLIGVFYKEGQGISQDKKEAYAWLNVSKGNGYKGYNHFPFLSPLDSLKREMTNMEIEEANSRIIEIKKLCKVEK